MEGNLYRSILGHTQNGKGRGVVINWLSHHTARVNALTCVYQATSNKHWVDPKATGLGILRSLSQHSIFFSPPTQPPHKLYSYFMFLRSIAIATLNHII